jgi:ligand-binding sensor domain-containing protein
MKSAKPMARMATACFVALLTVTLVVGAVAAQQVTPTDADVPVMTTYRVGDSVYVRSLAVDRRDRSLWVGTSVGVLNIELDSRDMKHSFTRDDGLANEYVFAIAVDPVSGVWFGTNAGGMTSYDNGNWKTYFPMHGLADYWVYAFAFDADTNLWVGTWDGVNLLDRQSGELTTYRDELINIWVYGVDVDQRGQVWFGTEGGVSMFDGANWRSWTHDDGLGAPNVGALPASTNTGLGTRSRHDLSVDVGGSESFNPNYVFATLVDGLGRGIWFGTWGGGVSLFDGADTWRNYTTADGLAGNVVYSLAQAADGGLWAGTNRGLSYFDGTTWRSYRHGLRSAHVYAVALDDDGNIWAGTKGAVTSLSFGE